MITTEQRQLRRKYIGSSDAAAVLGVDPYKSAADVWIEKTGRANDFEGNEHTDRGTLLEPALLEWAGQQLGKHFVRDVMQVHPSQLLAANFDGISSTDKFIVEAKTSTNEEGWGVEGTDEIPDRVLVQVHHQFAVAGPEYRLAYVPVLIPTFKCFDFRMYRVDRNEQLAEMIERAGVEFMEKYVNADAAPSDYRPSLEVLKRVRREPNKIIDVPDALVDHWIAAKAAAREAVAEVEQAQSALLAAMLDAEQGNYSRGRLTYFEQSRKEHVVKASKCRVLRLKQK